MTPEEEQFLRGLGIFDETPAALQNGWLLLKCVPDLKISSRVYLSVFETDNLEYPGSQKEYSDGRYLVWFCDDRGGYKCTFEDVLEVLKQDSRNDDVLNVLLFHLDLFV